MEVVIRPNAQSAATLVAKLIKRAIKKNPHCVLGLATGRTMESVYAVLQEMHKAGKIDFSLCQTFNLDEYVGIPPDNEHSYRHYMEEHLFSGIEIDTRNTHLPRGMAEDLDEECRRYEKKIKDVGGIDLQLLGIGRAGHIGFNEPLSALRSRTRVKALTPVTRAQNATLFENPEDVPRRAITMGVGTILKSKRCILLATGKEKAEIVAKAVEGPITGMISASALQLHPRCQVIVDEDAASELREKEYYRWIFDNEPEWQVYRS